MRRSVWLALALLVALPPRIQAGPIENLRPGEWYHVPNSKLQSVFPSPTPEGNTGPSAVMSAWSSGAYDTKRDRLIVWGGGHVDYSGNEVYAFSVNTLTWSRLTNPSYDPSGSGPYYPDGKPRARHTYDYVEYLPPPADRFCSFGGVTLYPGLITQTTDCFNFDTLQWERKADDTQSYGFGAPAVYDPVGGHVWQHGGSPSPTKLSEYDPIADRWTVRGDYQSKLEYVSQAVGVIDPKRRKYVVVGNGILASFNINGTGILPLSDLTNLTTGATSIQSSMHLGVAYDPVTDRIVAWDGGADVYLLNLDNLVWTRQPPALTNTVIPPPAESRGTNGRFRYIPSKNAFIVVNATDQDVYIYKLAAGGGAPPDSIPPQSARDLRTR